MPSSVFTFEKKTQKHTKHVPSLIFCFLKTQKHTKHMHHSNSLKSTFVCLQQKKNTKTRKIHQSSHNFYCNTLRKNTKIHKTQKTHLVIFCHSTSHIYPRKLGEGAFLSFVFLFILFSNQI